MPKITLGKKMLSWQKCYKVSSGEIKAWNIGWFNVKIFFKKINILPTNSSKFQAKLWTVFPMNRKEPVYRKLQSVQYKTKIQQSNKLNVWLLELTHYLVGSTILEELEIPDLSVTPCPHFLVNSGWLHFICFPVFHGCITV